MTKQVRGATSPRILRRFLPLAAVLLLLALVFVAPVAADGEVAEVDGTKYTDLQSAINAASDNDIITVLAGTHTISSTISVNKDITITGEVDDAGNPSAILDGGLTWNEDGTPNTDGTRIMAISGGKTVTLKNLTFQNGYSTYGGALSVDGTAIIENCVFRKNVDPSGDAMAIRAASGTSQVTISDTTFSENYYAGSASYAAVIYISNNYNDNTIVNCIFEDTQSTRCGGITINAAKATIDGCRFLNNLAQGWGCLNTDNKAQVDVINCYFEGNTGGQGIIYLVGDAKDASGTGYPKISGSVFVKNTATSTARNAIVYSSNGAVITDCIFAGNTGKKYDSWCGSILSWCAIVDKTIFIDELCGDETNRNIVCYVSDSVMGNNYYNGGGYGIVTNNYGGADSKIDYGIAATSTSVTYEDGILKIDGNEVTTGGVSFTVEGINYDAYVAQIGDTYYATLAKAIDMANGNTITLLSNVDNGMTIPAGKTVVFDGGSFSLSGSIAVEDGGSLSIIGGYFTENPSDAYLAESYKAVKIADDKWFVGSKITDLSPQKKTYTGQAVVYDYLDYTILYSQNGAFVENPTMVGLYNVTVYTDTSNSCAVGELENGLVIEPATLTVTYVSETIKAGETPKLDVKVTGFVNKETAETATGYSASALTNTNTKPGHYTLTPSGYSADNYVFTYVSGTLTIYKTTTAEDAEQKTDESGKQKTTYEETVAPVAPAEEGEEAKKVTYEVVIITTTAVDQADLPDMNPAFDDVTAGKVEAHTEKSSTGATLKYKPIAMFTAKHSNIAEFNKKIADSGVEITFTLNTTQYPTKPAVVILHVSDDKVNVVKPTIEKNDAKRVWEISAIVDSFSSYVLAEGEVPPEEKPKAETSNETPKGSSVWLQEIPTETPTPTDTVTPTETQPTQTPPTTLPTTEPESPLSVLAVLAGLGAVAVLRRR